MSERMNSDPNERMMISERMDILLLQRSLENLHQPESSMDCGSGPSPQEGQEGCQEQWYLTLSTLATPPSSKTIGGRSSSGERPRKDWKESRRKDHRGQERRLQ